MDEVWKDIEGFEGMYQVSSLGRIKSLERTVKGKWKTDTIYHELIRKPSTCKPYNIVRLSKNGKSFYKTVHRLVAMAFLPNIEEKPEVNHIDGNKKNNLLSNLEWVTRSENCVHYMKLGTRNTAKGEKHLKSILTAKQAEEIKYGDDPIAELAKKFGIAYQTAWAVRNGRTWKHI